MIIHQREIVVGLDVSIAGTAPYAPWRGVWLAELLERIAIVYESGVRTDRT